VRSTRPDHRADLPCASFEQMLLEIIVRCPDFDLPGNTHSLVASLCRADRILKTRLLMGRKRLDCFVFPLGTRIIFVSQLMYSYLIWNLSEGRIPVSSTIVTTSLSGCGATLSNLASLSPLMRLDRPSSFNS
jgi:hypothetical protein